MDLDRRFLARTVHLFTKLAFAALLEISEMRCKVAVQINTRLRTLPTQDTEHIPRLLHAEKLRLLSDPPLPQEEVQMLVRKLVARSPNVTTMMEGKVKRLFRQEGPTSIPHMAGTEREGPDNNPITTARTSTGIR